MKLKLLLAMLLASQALHAETLIRHGGERRDFNAASRRAALRNVQIII